MAIILRTDGERALMPVFGPFDVLREAEELAGGFWNIWEPGETTFMPRTDVYEEEGHLVVKTELPGMKKEDIEVKLERDILTIRAQKKEEEKKGPEHVRERRYGEYYRSMSLPFPVDEGHIEAEYEDGVLKVTLPKGKEALGRRIEIKGELPKPVVRKALKKAK